MNCDACPHMKKIRAALSPCASCDAGKLHGQVSINSATTDWAMLKRAQTDHTQSDGVTALSPDVEDAVRKLTATLFCLEPIELLLVQHVMRGGSYASFASVCYQLHKRLRTKEAELAGRKGGFRSLAQSWATKIAEKLPIMRPVFDAMTEARR